MNLLLKVSVLLLPLLGQALAGLQILSEWNTGFQAKFTVHVNQATKGWQVELTFEKNVDSIEAYNAKLVSLQGSTVVLTNQDYNGDLQADSDLVLDFGVRHKDGQGSSKVTRASFNGQPIDVATGKIQSSNTATQQTATNTATKNTASNTATKQTTSNTATKQSSSTQNGGKQGDGKYNYGEVIGKSLLFYEAQRSGKLPADNRISWRGDSFLKDGADVGLDLTGGYFDAGDHVKFGFPMAAMTTVMGWGLIEFRDGYVAAGEYENALEALRWSLDYFMKAHHSPNELYGQVGDGDVDHGYWGRPEDWPESRARPAYKISSSAPGSDLAGETAAAFATGYIIFKDSDPSYAAECLRHAKELYDFANQYRGTYTNSITKAQAFYNSWSGYGDELGWAAAWLYRATGEAKYLNDVKKHWSEFGLGNRPQEFGWDDKKAGLQVLMAEITKDPTYIQPAQAFCNYIVNEAPKTPKGLVYIAQWGSLRHASNVAFVCLVAAEAGINTDTYREFAKKQINYILGDTGRSFVVGYGVNPPTKPHHRGSSCPNRPLVCDTSSGANNPGPNYQTLTGALVGGPDAQDNYVDDRNDYVKNEVATDYNAGFQSALAGLNEL